MEDPKLTVRENSLIIKEKSLDYVPDPRGLGHEFHHAMLLNKDEIAQIDAETGSTYTYDVLLQKCIRTAVNLLVGGITKDDVICLCSSNHINCCVPIICSFLLGVKVAPLDTTLSLEEAMFLVGQIRPRIIFVTPDVVDTIEEALTRVDIECYIVLFGQSSYYIEFDAFLEPIEGEANFKPLPISAEETAVILFTKGQRDTFKGVCLSHYAIMMQCFNTMRCCNLGNNVYLCNYNKSRSTNGFLMALSFTTCSRISEIELLCCCTFTGVTKIICENFDPTIAWRLIDKYNITFMTCPTFQAIDLYKVGKPEGVEGKTLKMLLTYGTSLSKTNLSELRKLLPYCFISNSYGLIETTGRIAMFDFTKPGDIRDQYEKPTSCGKLVPGMTCMIVDPINEKILGANQAGELRFKPTELLMNGYHKMDNSFIFDKRGWVRTGDIALYDAKHRLYVLNRLRDVFMCHCWHIIPLVIETFIKEYHPAVKEAVVIGIPYEDKYWTQIPMAVVSLNKGMRDRVTEEDIENWANANLSKKLRLRAGVKIIKRIQLTISGEPNREEIREMVLSGDL